MIYTLYKNYIDRLFNECPDIECFSYINKDNIKDKFTTKDINDKASLYKSLMLKMNIKEGDQL